MPKKTPKKTRISLKRAQAGLQPYPPLGTRNPAAPTTRTDWRERAIAPLGQYIDVRSETRPEVVHHVYTGDSVQTPHCTCEAFRYGTRERDVLFTCKHIDLVVFGKGAT